MEDTRVSKNMQKIIEELAKEFSIKYKLEFDEVVNTAWVICLKSTIINDEEFKPILRAKLNTELAYYGQRDVPLSAMVADSAVSYEDTIINKLDVETVKKKLGSKNKNYVPILEARAEGYSFEEIGEMLII